MAAGRPPAQALRLAELSYRRIVLAIDDTEDWVHGRRRLARFHAHHGGYGFPPVHVDETTTGKPVTVIVRPAQDL